MQFRVEVVDELDADDAEQALRSTLVRIRSEETVASVTCIETGEVVHYEIHSGLILDEEG